jgi:hypothetical protein
MVANIGTARCVRGPDCDLCARNARHAEDGRRSGGWRSLWGMLRTRRTP